MMNQKPLSYIYRYSPLQHPEEQKRKIVTNKAASKAKEHLSRKSSISGEHGSLAKIIQVNPPK